MNTSSCRISLPAHHRALRAWSSLSTLFVLISTTHLAQAADDHAATPSLTKPTITRNPENPIIRPDMIPGKDQGAPAGWNIMFPSLIKVPSWLPNPLGKYYLYFSSHHGTYIRLAYADQVDGPWKIFAPGSMTLHEVDKANLTKGDPQGHVASPDVHVDDTNKKIRMYFHSKGAVGHMASVALSDDGLHFKPLPGALGGPYFRVFQWKEKYYAIDREADILRSNDGLTGFQKVSGAFALAADDPNSKSKSKKKNKSKDDEDIPGRVRHTGIMLEDNLLSIFYTRTGDAPESIMMTRILLNDDPKTWKAATPILVLAPETDYEGVKLPIAESHGGTVIKTYEAAAGKTGMVHQLRDPFIYRENGQQYLFYAVAGERGIGLAKMLP